MQFRSDDFADLQLRFVGRVIDQVVLHTTEVLEEQKCKHEIEQKLAEGHMLTEREAQMLARFAEEQGQEAEGM